MSETAAGRLFTAIFQAGHGNPALEGQMSVWSIVGRTDSLGSTWSLKMTEALEALIAEARRFPMTEEQMREQRLSFVYGNTHIENERITREMVAEADRKVSEEDLETRI